MSIQKYSINQHPINTLLTWIKEGEIAIPKIQRPFVWSGGDYLKIWTVTGRKDHVSN